MEIMTVEAIMEAVTGEAVTTVVATAAAGPTMEETEEGVATLEVTEDTVEVIDQATIETGGIEMVAMGKHLFTLITMFI